jgi:DNA polymerase-3 subunit epsilon
MQINLTKDLVFFDLETTGLNVMRDRIVQIALIKLFKDGRPSQELSLLINPGIPMAEEAMAVHGLTPKDLANKPTFQQVAQKIYDFIGNADLGGYNSNRFDVPMLMEEFARVGLDFDVEKRRLIDAQRIFYKMEPRTLKAAYRFYCNTELEDAHDALADVRATLAVFKGQLTHYEGKDLLDEEGNWIEKPIKNDMQVIHNFVNDTKILDVTQRLRMNPDGTIVFNFGKYMGQSVGAVLSKDRNYYTWIMTKEFSVQVKKMVKKLVKDYEQQQREKEKTA